MGRRKKMDVEEPIAAPRPAGSNGFNPEKTKAYVERVERLNDDITSIMLTALSKCKEVHGDIKIVYDEAKDTDGIPKKALKKVVKARQLEAKARKVREDLEGDEQDSFDMIRHALGDLAELPLGAAVLAKTGHVDVSTQPFSPASSNEAHVQG